MNPGLIVVLVAAGAVWTYVVAELCAKEIERRRIASQSSALLLGILLGFIAVMALEIASDFAEAEWLQSYEWPLGLLTCFVVYARNLRRWIAEEPALRERLEARAAADRSAVLTPPVPYKRRPDITIPSPGAPSSTAPNETEGEKF